MAITVEARESSSIVEPGVYDAKIVDMIEEDGNFGGQIKFVFELADQFYESGARAGENIQQWGWASTTLSPKSKLWKWLRQVTGITPVFGQPFDVTAALLGQPVIITMGYSESGDRVVVTDVNKGKGAAKAQPAARPAPAAAAPAEATDKLICVFPKCGREAFSLDDDGNAQCPKHGGLAS